MDRGWVRSHFSFWILTASISLSGCFEGGKVTLQNSPFYSGPLFSGPQGSQTASYAEFRQVIQSKCIFCHDSSVNGNFIVLDESGWLLSNYVVPGDPAQSKIYNHLQGVDVDTGPKNMPRGLPPLSLQERQIVKGYILGLAGKKPNCNPVPPPAPRASLLNRREFNFAILDLLGLAGNHSDFFPSRPPDSLGYDHHGSPFLYDPVFTEKLYDKLEWLLDALFADTVASQPWTRCGTSDYQSAACFDSLVRQLGLRAWRRPLTSTESTEIQTVANKQTAALARLKTAYLRILMAPEFLFKLEPTEGQIGIRNLTHYEIASRLSFLIWSSVPDTTLLDLAAQSRLRDPAVLQQQVTRMMNDPKGNRWVDALTDQWLKLGTFAQIQADPNQFPNFPSTLKQSMLGETRTFLRDWVKNRPVADLITSKDSFLNDEMAAFYGLSSTGLNGSFQKTNLPSTTKRRGFLTQGTALMLSYRGQQHKPVLRGNYILSQIMCDQPNGVVPPGAINESSTLPPNPTFKQILIAHRSNPNCAGCHISMDAIGLAFDHFDGIGKVRANYGPSYQFQPIDTAESLYGKSFQSSYDAVDILANSDLFYRCAGKFLYGYVYQAPESNDQKCAVHQMGTQMKSNAWTVTDTVRSMVSQPQFIQRRSE